MGGGGAAAAAADEDNLPQLQKNWVKASGGNSRAVAFGNSSCVNRRIVGNNDYLQPHRGGNSAVVWFSKPAGSSFLILAGCDLTKTVGQSP